MNTYPIIRFTARHGAIIAWSGALLALAAAIALAIAFSSLVVMIVGAGVALVVLVLLYSYTELVRIIADTLLPR
ncbi:hypothetical protein [Acuticoccus kandeliae]|uniref:hypothetical protein n=1 Tax=Acuticoccus kandeliae TaxID=2073160 RepID=UPI000D3EC273|nr:hypothetical protein [Acuticoccus kandeliae]